MKLLLTSKGLNTTKIQQTLTSLLTKPIEQNKTQIFYSYLKVANMDIQAYIQEDKNTLIKLGVPAENIQTFELHDDNPPKLDKVDIVIVLGGNEYHYMRQIRDLGLESEIRKFIDRGGVYVGRSAGSLIMSQELDEAFSGDVNDVGLSDVTGFGYIDFNIVVHWDKKSGDKLTSIVKHSWKTDKRIITLTDEHAILVQDSDFQIT